MFMQCFYPHFYPAFYFYPAFSLTAISFLPCISLHSLIPCISLTFSFLPCISLTVTLQFLDLEDDPQRVNGGTRRLAHTKTFAPLNKVAYCKQHRT